MIANLTCDIPKNHFYVAMSGGVDSLALAAFLASGKKSFSAVHIHHGTEHANDFLSQVTSQCEWLKINLHVFHIDGNIPSGRSHEDWWREKRYEVFHNLDAEIMTAHTLDDQVEQWIFSSLHGNPKLIPVRNQNVIRPFLRAKKSDLEEFCKGRNLRWINDPSNFNVRYSRSRIRARIVPEALEVNPGLYTVIRKKVDDLVSSRV